MIDAPPTTGIERAAAAVLRVGVLVSVGLILAGVALSLLRHPDYLTDAAALHHLTHPGGAYPPSFSQLWRDLAALRGRAVVTVGLVLLILTPLVRVLASLIAFARERDRLFTALTAVVLATLVVSYFLGRSSGGP